MCTALYIATAFPIEIRLGTRLLGLSEQQDIDRPAALASLRYAWVYQISTSEGCCCPLGILAHDEDCVPSRAWDTVDDDTSQFREPFLDALGSWLELGPVDVYPCCVDEEFVPPDTSIEATLADLRADWSLLRERRVTHLTA